MTPERVRGGGSLTTWNYYSETGLLREKLDHNNKGPEYTYTAAGRLHTRDWARFLPGTQTRIRTTYGHTSGRLTSVTYNDGTPNLVYSHDTLGRTRTVTRAGNNHAEYVYDPATLRLVTEKLNRDTHERHLHRHHDSHGRPLSLNLATTAGVSQYTTGYGHDIAGRLDRVWHHPALTNGIPQGNPTFTYGYTYTQASPGDLRVGAASGPNLKQDFMPYTVTRNAAGGNPALTANRTYEGTRDALKTIENKAGASIVSSYTYFVNSLGQRDSVTTSGSAFSGVPANWNWLYDSLGQITVADSPTAARDRAFEYDIIGNRKKFAHGTTVLPPNDNYSANTLNQYTLVPNYTPQPVHDLDGNLTRGPIPGPNGNLAGVQTPTDATAIQWDAENRMISCTIGAGTFLYEYDHLSRLHTLRTGTTVYRRYHYDGWNRIGEFTDTALLDTFTWGLDVAGASGSGSSAGFQAAGGVGGLLATRWVSAVGSPTYFPTYDGNGNVSEYLTTTGAVASHYEYDPFGGLTRLTGSTSIRYQYRFSTKPRNSNTGLYYYAYRYYDPVTGRWPSRDPIEEQGGISLYGFLGNDGVNQTDFLGLATTIHGEENINSSTDINYQREEVPDDFGRTCCPDELIEGGIQILYQNSDFQNEVPGHAALKTPSLFMGYYPYGTGLDPRYGRDTADGNVVDENTMPSRAWSPTPIKYKACPFSIWKIERWMKRQKDLFDTNHSMSGLAGRRNPFGGPGGYAYHFANGPGGRNCLGWVSEGIKYAGGEPPMVPCEIMKLKDGGVQNPTKP